MIKRYYYILLLVLCPFLLNAQVDYISEFNRLTDYETSDQEKQSLSLELTDALVRDLQQADFIIDSLSVRQLKLVSSADEALRLVTWHYSLSDATSQYGGIILYGEQVLSLRFNDMPIAVDKEYTQDNWCGGIYYDVIPVEKKGKTFYTLLAWDGNNGVTSKKIIDVLSFDKKGRPIFGFPFFENGRMMAHRAIIEYPASNSMLLEYDAQQNEIISNALFANDDKFTDVSGYSSVSDDFNVYRFENSKWMFYANVDLRLNKKDSKALQNNGARPSRGL